jgi:hypothetical protein
MCWWIIGDRTEELEATRQGSGVLLVFRLCRLSTDRCSSLVPLIMLNTCLIFSWLNKIPFDREASGIIRVGIYTGVRIGAEGGMTGAWRVSPRAGKAWFLAVGWSLGTAAPVCPTIFTWIVSLMICSSLDRWVWFVWGRNHQLVRNRFESPSLLDSEHLTRVMAS